MPPEFPATDPPPESAPPPAWQGTHLLRRIAEGDEQALESLHRALADRLFSMALHWLDDEGAAREALQDTFLRIWKKAGNYDAARSNPFTWSAMILRGVCLDQLRKRRRMPRLLGDLAPGRDPLPTLAAQDGVDDIFFHDTVNRVRRALHALDPEERETVRAALFDPAGTRELAERWRLPPATAKTRIHRAMGKLRQLLTRP